MSTNFPGNPWSDVHSHVSLNMAGLMSAMYLMAYEQRTANLINLYTGLLGSNRPVPWPLRDEIDQRLGLKEEDDEDE